MSKCHRCGQEAIGSYPILCTNGSKHDWIPPLDSEQRGLENDQVAALSKRQCTAVLRDPDNPEVVIYCSLLQGHSGAVHIAKVEGGTMQWPMQTVFRADEPVDMVNHPPHYNSHPSGIECIVVARHHDFNIGNVLKYLWRAGIKGQATAVEDLKKAAWYLNDEIKKVEAEK